MAKTRQLPLHVTAVLSLCFASCASTPEPVPFHAPDVSFEVLYSVAFFQSGPRDDKDLPTSADEALSLRIHLFALAEIPEKILTPIDTTARFIMSTLEGYPLLASPWLTSGSRAGQVSNAGAFMESLTSGAHGECAPMGSLLAVLPGSVAAVVMAKDATPGLEEGFPQPFERSATVFCYRSADKTHFKLAVAVEGLVYVAQEEEGLRLVDEESQYTPPTLELARELMIKGRDVPAPVEAMAVIVPSPFDEAPAGALAFVIEFFEAPEGDGPKRRAHEETFQRCVDELSTAGAGTEGYSNVLEPGRSGWEGYSATLRALASPKEQRMALAFVAREMGAMLMEDIALSVSDESVSKLAAEMIDSADTERVSDEESLAWLLEKKALEHYLDALKRWETTLGMEGIVSMHIGEPSRRISSLEEILDHADDLKKFGTLLYYENLRFLDYPLPAARVIAYDWLAARNLAPAGYDPLAPYEERHAALVKALASLETELKTGETP